MEAHGNKPRTCQKQGKARYIPDKAINHIIRARESKINARERFRKLGCGQQLKSYIHTPKPQIQSVELRRKRLGIRTIPCIFGEEGRIKRLGCVFCVFLCVKMCLGETKNVQKTSRHRAKPKKVSPFSWSGDAQGLLQPWYALQGGSPSNGG